jgi:hypothetical protein
MLPRLPLTILVVVASFGAGFASSRLLERDAHAQGAPFASTVYVPVDGLAFRSFDGRVVARLAYDRHGGYFELYDGDERPSTALQASTPADGSDGRLRPRNPLDMRIQ